MKRKSLPGVDELFGTSNARSARESPGSDIERPPVRGPDDRAFEDAATLMRRMTADEGSGLRAVRDAAQDLDVPSPEVGALLRWAATLCEARAVVEIGSAGGLSGLWMLRGLPDTAVLTSLEPVEAAHRVAADAFAEFAPHARVRCIHGAPGTMLERLADASYDLVVLQADHGHYPDHLTSAKRLLRRGGMLVARGISPVGEHKRALAQFLHDLVEDPWLSATVLPIDGGVALANLLPDAA